jgi:hypothetical protein
MKNKPAVPTTKIKIVVPLTEENADALMNQNIIVVKKNDVAKAEEVLKTMAKQGGQLVAFQHQDIDREYIDVPQGETERNYVAIRYAFFAQA